MRRHLLSVLSAFAVGVCTMQPIAYGQYGAPADQVQGYPPQQPSYPQAQSYPTQYPQAQYPQAQQDPNAQDTGGDEQHGVARLSIVQGDVNVRRGDNGQLVAAVMNAPVMAPDRVQTSPGSRAEVELDYANLIRLAPNTDLGLADVEYRRFQVQLGAGTIIYRVLRDSDAQAEVDTPSVAFRPEGQGQYRVAVMDDGTTQITVQFGRAELFSPRGSQQLMAGQTVLVRGNAADPEFQPGYQVARDQFDDWSAMRDRDLLASQSYRYVSRDVYGADDLDTFGNWVPSQFGQVWEPRVAAADWSPYSDGQWSWQPYYGWTWVDSAPWGWAPYHYGRWFWNGGGHGWCWWPGVAGPRYLWSPAQVGFFGLGGGVGFGFAGLGWVALAPFEVFHPWWGRGWARGEYGYGGYGRGENLAAMYRNAGIRGGAMTAGYNGFGGPHQRFSPATRSQLGAASLFRGQIPVSPTRMSYQFSGRQANANPRLASVANRQFFYHQGSGSPTGAYGSRFTAGQQRSYSGAASYSVPRAPSSGSGWQRFGDPGTANRQSFTSAQEPSGWHHFGDARQTAPAPAGAATYSRSYSSPSAASQARQSLSNPTGGYSGGSGGSRTPHYSAPAQPHYSAPSSSRGNGGGGGSSHGNTGGSHSSSGGHRGH